VEIPVDQIILLICGMEVEGKGEQHGITAAINPVCETDLFSPEALFPVGSFGRNSIFSCQ
jgi:hypothetical protein